jgi:hypothetical protein
MQLIVFLSLVNLPLRSVVCGLRFILQPALSVAKGPSSIVLGL